MKKAGMLIAFLATVLIIPTINLAGTGSNHDGSMMKHNGEMKACHGMCPMFITGAQTKVQNIENGVTITITSKDKATVQKIQEKAKIRHDNHTKAMDENVVCPVMGTRIKKSQAVNISEYKGKTYYFCCSGCKPAFDKNPEKYVK